MQGHRDYVIKVLLHGLTGPLDDKTYTQVMVPMGAQKDDWIAAIASYVRNDFGNTGTFVTAGRRRARARRDGRAEDRRGPSPELEASLPVLLQSDPAWKVTASHNPAAAADALTIVGWTSGVPQEAGMWVQVELPQPLTLTEIQFNTPAGRGFGPPPAAAPGPGMRGGGPAGTTTAPAPGQTPPAARVRLRRRLRPVQALRRPRSNPDLAPRATTRFRFHWTGRSGHRSRRDRSARSPSPRSRRSARSSCALTQTAAPQGPGAARHSEPAALQGSGGAGTIAHMTMTQWILILRRGASRWFQNPMVRLKPDATGGFETDSCVLRFYRSIAMTS